MSDEHPASSEQLELLHAAVPASTAKPAAKGVDLAASDPIALVQVDVGLPHLDRPFEYTVPAALAETAVPGARVKVRFAGQDVDGFVLERRAEAEHQGRLAPVRRVVSPEAVLTPALLTLCRAVAARYAGSLGDVLRLAVPPRHARAEKALPTEPPTPAPDITVPEVWSGWSAYAAGPALLSRISAGESPAAAWLAAPGASADQDWPVAMAQLAQAALASGRGALLIAPDARDVERLDQALQDALGAGQHVRLTAEQGPQARYTAWLKVLRGHVRCVVGTRAAAFAPVADLGVVVCWDDGDDSLAEPRAPYPHVREVLRLRAEQSGAALVLGGFTRSVPVQQWVENGLLRPVEPVALRGQVPRVVVAGEDLEVERVGPAARAHLPTSAWQAAKKALEHGPVLVQVPRRGYLPSLSCQSCRTPARCRHCHGPLALPASDQAPTCRWCGQVERQFRCPECDGGQLRSTVVGARRTAEELGRAFPGVPLHRSGAGELLTQVSSTPAIVVSTPGAEPVAENGYAATLLLDAWALLDRPALEVSAEALRRWMAAAALTRSRDDGGVVVLCGAPAHATLPAVEALVRWAPAWFAARELAERAELRLPPAVWMAELSGPRVDLGAALSWLELGNDVDVLGPLEVKTMRGGEQTIAHRVLLRADDAIAPALAERLVAMRAARSARKEKASIGVRIDPDPSSL